MLAAHLRRASRALVGLTMVATVGAGLSLGSAGAFDASVSAVENDQNTVQVRVFPTSGGAIIPGQELAVTVSLTNNSSLATTPGEVIVTTDSTVLESASALDNWFARSEGEQQPGRWLGVIDAPALAIGESVQLTATLSLTNAFYGSDWGPRGLAADLEVNGDSAGSGRGVLIWAGPGETPVADLVTLLPVVSPASASGLLTADELTVLTSPQGVLSSQVSAATGRNVTLAIDPRIISSIIALGNDAPETATAWLARLTALPNESFVLAYADADVALQAQAGATVLATAGFSDQPLLTSTGASLASVSPTPNTSPAPATEASESPTPNGLPSLAESSWAPTLTGIVWPAENTVMSSDMGVLFTNDTQFAILSSTNVASGANSPAHTSVDSRSTLIANAGLSRAIRAASSAQTDTEWEENFSFASAYLATTALDAATQRVAIASLSRHSLGDVSEGRLTQTLDRLAQLGWVDNGTLSSVANSASAPQTSVVDKPESEDRVKVAQGIMGRHRALTGFSSVLTTPSLLTDSTTRNELALLSIAWRSSEGWPGAVNSYLQQTTETLDSIRIVPSSEIQMVGGQVNIPVTIENSLALPVTVLVRATPSNARLTVDSDATVVVQSKAQSKALVPVKARVGNGSVLLTVSLYSPDGVPVGGPASLPVNVRADWESWGLGGVGALFVALLIVGVVRTVRKRQREGAPRG